MLYNMKIASLNLSVKQCRLTMQHLCNCIKRFHSLNSVNDLLMLLDIQQIKSSIETYFSNIDFYSTVYQDVSLLTRLLIGEERLFINIPTPMYPWDLIYLPTLMKFTIQRGVEILILILKLYVIRLLFQLLLSISYSHIYFHTLLSLNAYIYTKIRIHIQNVAQSGLNLQLNVC